MSDCPHCTALRAENEVLRRQMVELRADVARMERHLVVPNPDPAQRPTDPLIAKNREHA